MIKITESEIIGKCIQLVLFQFRIHVSGQSYGIKICVRERNSKVIAYLAYKACIKAGVMSNEGSATGKIKKSPHRLLLRRRSFHHIVGYPGKLRNTDGNRYSGICKGIKNIKHLAASYQNRTDLGYSVV